MKTLHFDLCGGASGDMLTAGLLDAGVPAEYLRQQLQRLPMADEFDLRIEERNVGGFRGTTVHVDIPGHGHHRHDHGGHDHDHHHDHGGHDGHHHHHDHEHEHDHDHHHHHRNLSDIEDIVKGAGFDPGVTETILAVFRRLAKAEAAVHGTTVEKIHFHEVGAVDSIVDICAVCLGVAYLHPDRITTTPLPTGHGSIRSAHGIIPLPAPATVELAKNTVALRPLNVEGELTTPTAAALMAQLAGAVVDVPRGTLTAAGTALGHRVFEGHYNMLRVMLLESGDAAQTAGEEAVMELATTIDDASPQTLAWTIQRLLDSGALDAWLQPVIMKKGRPGFVLTALCAPGDADGLAALIFAETDSLGIRRNLLNRNTLQRCVRSVETPYGEVRVKGRRLPGDESIRWVPEYDDCAAAARHGGVPLNRVMEACKQAAVGLDWPES